MARLWVDSRCALVSIPVLKEILLRSRLASSKTAKIWAQRFAQCERSNVPVGQFCQSIGCSPMFSPRGVVQRDLWGRRTGSPSYRAYIAYDGLPVRRARRTARTTDFQSVGLGVQGGLKQPPFCVCKHRIPPRSPSSSNSREQARGVRRYHHRQRLCQPSGLDECKSVWIDQFVLH